MSCCRYEPWGRALRPVVPFVMVCLIFVSACSRTEPVPAPARDGLTQLDPRNPADAWLLEVQKKIHEIWRGNAPKGLPGTVVAGVTVRSDGELVGVEILESSGVVALDEYAVDAIRIAAPFPRFAASMGGEFKSFRTRFEYGDKLEEG